MEAVKLHVEQSRKQTWSNLHAGASVSKVKTMLGQKKRIIAFLALIGFVVLSMALSNVLHTPRKLEYGGDHTANPQPSQASIRSIMTGVKNISMMYERFVRLKNGPSDTGVQQDLEEIRVKVQLVVSTLHTSLADAEHTLEASLYGRAIDDTIILICVDSGYAHMAMNLYYTSFNKLNINNYLFMGTDAQVCVMLQRQGIECYTHQQSTMDDSASNWGTKEFKRKTHHKTKVTLDALRLGYTVLIVDVDIVFFRNPIPYLSCKRCDIQIQSDMIEGNSGFYLARPTPAALTLHDKAYNASLLPNALSNQKVLDRIMEKMSRNGEIIVQTLSDKMFPNGEVYFEQGRRMFGSDNPCTECIIVHNNWILTGAAKELRFKETGLWQVDTAGYYSDPNTKYIWYNNPENIGSNLTLREETQALKAALVLGHALNRSVILPRFHCHSCTFRACRAPHQRCAFGTFYKVAVFDQSFYGAYRESTFLNHALVPREIKSSLSPLFFISTKNNFDPHLSDPGPLQLLKPDNGHTPNASEIHSWFDQFSKHSILRFHSLYSSFRDFEAFEEVEQKLAKAFVKCDYRNFDYKN